MKRASKALGWLELALWVAGVALLGVALAAVAERRSYQAQQERVLFSPKHLEPRAAEENHTPRRDAVAPAPVPIAPETVPGPPPAIDDKPAAEREPVFEEKPAAREEPRETALADPAAIGRIDIPRLGLSAIIREGADEETLDRAVGLVPGAAYPGQVGNVVLAGHRDTFFRALRFIRAEDRIRLLVPPHEYVYRVESTRVVSPEETDVLQSRGVEELTLVTCYPFRYIGPAPDRFIVRAIRER